MEREKSSFQRDWAKLWHCKAIKAAPHTALLQRDENRFFIFNFSAKFAFRFYVAHANGLPGHTIFHCFTGGADEARRALDVGAFLSFSGIVTFPSADDVRAAAALCPADRILVETDSPYLAPVPHRGQRNQPAFVPLVGARVAGVRGVNVSQIEHDTEVNARVAFRLTQS
jgi:TatD family hydrolase